MIQTRYGTYNGDSWEEHCQLLLKTKYGTDGYQEMTAHTSGDLGIEGFTRTGIVFQCYCPDEEYDAKKLYEAQRDKVTKDLGKLKRSKKQLLDFFGSIKIKKWIFLTPIILNKDIVSHCQTKAQEYKGMKDMQDILDSEFDVLVHDEGYYAEEILLVKRVLERKVEMDIVSPDKQEIIDWKNCESESIEILNRKIGYLFENIQDQQTKDNKTNKYVDLMVRNYLKGQKVLSRMQDTYGLLYEKQVRIKSSIAEHLEDEVLITDLPPKQLLDQTLSKYKDALKSEKFHEIFEFSIYEDLCREAISEWLINCPLDFGG